MSIDELVLDRVIAAAPESVRLVLLFCELGFVICQGKKTLIIKCPNTFAADRINNAIFAGMGQRVNRLGINQYLIDNGEGFTALHSFIRNNFLFVGYSEDGSDPQSGSRLWRARIIDVPLPWQL